MQVLLLYVFALTLLALTARADTVLGGIVDYLPKCYQGSEALLYVEYNSGICHHRVQDDNCSCESNTSVRRAQLTNVGGDKCVYVTKADTYKLADTKNIAEIPSDVFKNNRSSTKYYSGVYNSQSSNSPVTQALELDKSSTHIGISLWKGIKMVRFQYLNNGQRQDWYQGVQIRFTDDFKQRLSIRDLGNFDEVKFYPDTGMISQYHDLIIDLQCFYITSIIPFFRREQGQHLIDCMKFVESHRTDPASADVPASGSVTNVADLTNCEQGSNFQDVSTVTKSVMEIVVGFLKNLAIAAISFVPVAGPFLAVGIDVAFDIVASGAEGEDFVKKALGDAGYDAAGIQAGVVVKQIGGYLLKFVTKRKGKL
ncbi:hypothetical protein BGZ81_010640 [Podila clonocystis]|nr:hypothetical protein BGZ81_010640 [Podila clonocystis]